VRSTKVDIFNALKSSVALNALVGLDTSGIKQIFSFYPPSTAVYPCVGFYRISGQVGSADGKLSGNKNELYSIDCFAKSMTACEDMELAIDAAMDTLDYLITAEHVSDLYEDATKLFHKPLRYRLK